MLRLFTKVKAFWRQSGKGEQTWWMLPIQSTRVLPEKLRCKSYTVWFSGSRVYKRVIASCVLASQKGMARWCLLMSLNCELPEMGLVTKSATWFHLAVPCCARGARVPLLRLIKHFKVSTSTLRDTWNLNPHLNFSATLLQYFHSLCLLQIGIYL